MLHDQRVREQLQAQHSCPEVPPHFRKISGSLGSLFNR